MLGSPGVDTKPLLLCIPHGLGVFSFNPVEGFLYSQELAMEISVDFWAGLGYLSLTVLAPWVEGAEQSAGLSSQPLMTKSPPGLRAQPSTLSQGDTRGEI